jgi:hypothetical protein
LDASFLDTYGTLDDYTPKSVANMRIKFAQDLLEGYQFLFGPDVEFDDGSVRHFFIYICVIHIVIIDADEGKAFF